MSQKIQIDNENNEVLLFNKEKHKWEDGTISIQARRPIYKTAYNSVLLNYIDKDFQFKYEEIQPLQFDDTSNLSDLTSALAYYINVILGLDFDTRPGLGGEPGASQPPAPACL